MKGFCPSNLRVFVAAGALLFLSCQTGVVQVGQDSGKAQAGQTPKQTTVPGPTTTTTLKAQGPAPVVAAPAAQLVPALPVVAAAQTVAPVAPPLNPAPPLTVPATPAPISTESVPTRAPSSGTGNGPFFVSDGISYVARTEGKAFSVYSEGTWKKTFLRGVNIGAGIPGHFPGELAVTKADYLRWFRYISDMNADVIRVYTTLMPQFYDALLEYNSKAAKPLWLMQGVWLSEELIQKHKTAYADDGIMVKQFIKDAKDLVDVLHGNITLPLQPGFASGTYRSDVSRWVIGWIMGIEWDPYFVSDTDAAFPDRNSYKGKYLYTEKASPFEAFLCQVCDATVAYEVDKYRMMRPIAVNNWPTADPLKHPNEPYEMEDICTLDVEHIKASPVFHSGWYASFHIYPYYPDFINVDTRYTRFYDEDARVNTYRAYLRELMAHYTIPVLVAEFGVPASRGMAHRAPYSGYNQGNHSETEQGEIDSHLLGDIYREGYCGGIVFVWQDEWFKRTWNNMDLDVPDTRPFWSNYQTNEQNFGLLAFDPGKDKTACEVDGDPADWKEDTPVGLGKGIRIFAKGDERYFYFMADIAGFDAGHDTLLVALDTIPGQGNTSVAGRDIKFSHPADFLISITRRDNSRIMVDAYYDTYYYMYAEWLKFLPKIPANNVRGSGVFNPILLALSRKVKLPETKVTIPFSGYETGRLRFGNSNPADPNYDSIADYCIKDSVIELRIPWQLLNVMDPANRKIMADHYAAKGILAQDSGDWRVGAGVLKSGKAGGISIGMLPWTLKGWALPTSHERLKESYYILRDAFRDLK